MRDEYLIFGSPLIGEEEIEEVVATIRGGWLGTGPKTHRFEREFARYVESPQCVAVSSCTAALHMTLLAAGLGPGDEVIVPAMTFCATANTVVHTGATPVFADISLPRMTIDPADIVRRITPRTRAIIPVHFHGLAADMEEIMAIAAKHDLLVIEDAAHAIETRHAGKPMGYFGDAACFSFYVTKNMMTVEGGMVATRHADWVERIKVSALHGLSQDAWARFSDVEYRHYEVVSAGFKCNMTDIQASFGIHQLARIEKNLLRRVEIWNRYDQALADLPVSLPPAARPDERHSRHIYALRIDERSPLQRDELMHALHRRKIGTGVHYTALHLQPYYAIRFGHKRGDFPNAEAVGDTTLSLPLSAALSDTDVDDVVSAMRELLASQRSDDTLRSSLGSSSGIAD